VYSSFKERVRRQLAHDHLALSPKRKKQQHKAKNKKMWSNKNRNKKKTVKYKKGDKK